MQDRSYDDDDDEHDDHERNAQQTNANMAQMDIEIDANDGEVDVNEILYGKKEDPISDFLGPFSGFPESDLFAVSDSVFRAARREVPSHKTKSLLRKVQARPCNPVVTLV